MNLWTYFAALVLFLAIDNTQGFVTQCCEEYCYGTDSDRVQARHYATKSAYQIIKSGDLGRYYNVPSKNLNDNLFLNIMRNAGWALKVIRG